MTPRRFSTFAAAALLCFAAPATAQQQPGDPEEPAAAEPAEEAVDRDATDGAVPEMAAIVEAYREGDYVTAREGLARLAPGGTPIAKYRYGRILLEGLGGPRDPIGALEWLTEASEENNIDATTLLAQMYLGGIGTARNPNHAVQLLERAATRGHARAQFLLGESLRLGEGTAPDAEKAFNWYVASAEQQNSNAQYALSRAYALGQGTAQDRDKARKWLQEAASNGLPVAQFYLASNMEAGAGGLPADPAGALPWYRRAAENGNADARRILGTKYLRGDGVEADPDEGLRWLRLAASAGDPGAMSNLGWAYATGSGVERDDAVARDWYEKAADRGLPRAMLALAAFYESGRGGPEDLGEAVSYYRKALVRGAEPAAARLGLLVARGRVDDIVAPQTAAPWVAAAARAGEREALDWLEARTAEGVYQAQGRLAEIVLGQEGQEADAVEMFRAAANAGDVYAQYRLGQLYSEGNAVEQDYVAAHKWFNISATHGLANAIRMRDVVSRLMTPEQVAEAQSLARAFMENAPVPPRSAAPDGKASR